MSAFLLDWLSLLIRWAHILLGVGWIGTSFYFIALDFSLRSEGEVDQDRGILGASWLVHGGGFYHVKKYIVAPDNLPKNLIWYKWDAYLTWVTGFALLAVQYYLNAETYLIDPNKFPMTSFQAIAISVISLTLGWVVYNLICRAFALSRPMLTAVLVYGLIVLAAYGFTMVYSGRGALIHAGAFVGTLMAANVFAVIIPNQKKIVAALLDNKKPDENLGKMSKQRSLHNNYLTLPVLLMMVSNHYPILARYDRMWLVVALIIVVGAGVRHAINRHEAGDGFKSFAWALPLAAIALFSAILITAPKTSFKSNQSISNKGGGDDNIVQLVSDARVVEIIKTHCAACHVPIEGAEEYFVAPQGIRLETIDDLTRHRRVVAAQAVFSQAMPLGNASLMTSDEREELGRWIAQQDGKR